MHIDGVKMVTKYLFLLNIDLLDVIKGPLD